MRITQEQGKKYRAYSPDEFFKSPESPQQFFNLSKPEPKRTHKKDLADATNQNQTSEHNN